MNDLSSIAVLILSVFGSALLGGLVLRQNPKSATNVVFGVMNGVLVLWSIAMFFSVRILEPDRAIWVIRSIMVLVIIHLSSVFVFVSIFPSPSFHLPRKLLMILSGIAGLCIILALSPWVFTHVVYFDGLPHTITGPGMIVYGPLSLGFIAASIARLVQKYRRAERGAREMLRLILIGFAFMLSLQVSFNFFAPVLFNNVSFIEYGPLFVLIFQCFAAIAILRYRFLDVRIIFRKSVIVGMSILLATLIYGWALSYLESIAPLPSRVSWVVGPVLLLVGYEGIKKMARALFDRYIFTDALDPSNQLDFDKRFQNVRGELYEWFAEVSKKISDVLGNQEIKLFLVDRVNHDLIQFFPRGKARFSENHEGVQFLSRLSEPALLSALREQRGQSVAVKGFLDALKRKGDVIVPLAYCQSFLGFLVLRSKEVGRIYSLADFRFLTELASSFTYSLNESLTYSEAFQRFEVSLRERS